MYKVWFYVTRRGDYPVKDFIEKLDKRSRAKIWRHIELLEKHGPHLLRPYAAYVEDKVRELRVKIRHVSVRIFYFFFMGRSVILLHAYSKKSDRLPGKEIGKAKRNMEDFIDRYSRGEITIEE